jgi:general stress protein 26
MNNQVLPRPLSERREAAVEHLRSLNNLWLATASDGRGPHLIPMSYWWDGSRLTTATLEDSRTLKNLRVQPKVRAALGSTGDVLMIDATAVIVDIADMDTAAADGYARASGNDPRSVSGFTYIQLIPQRMQVWRGARWPKRGGPPLTRCSTPAPGRTALAAHVLRMHRERSRPARDGVSTPEHYAGSAPTEEADHGSRRTGQRELSSHTDRDFRP